MGGRIDVCRCDGATPVPGVGEGVAVNTRVVLLGVKGGPAVRDKGAWPTSSLIEIGGRRAVVDCGHGVTRGLVEAGVALRDLSLVFITHLHSDHYLELGPLLHTAWTTGMRHPVRVFGPVGLKRHVELFLEAMAFDIDTRIADEGRPDLRKLVQVHEHGEGAVLDEDSFRVDALRVEHPPIVDAFALRFDAGGRRVVFSGDTAFFPALIDFSRGADLLVHEAMLEKGVANIIARTPNVTTLREHLYAAHTLVEDVGRIAKGAGVGHLALNHLIPADDPAISEADWRAAIAATWSGPLTVGRDGLEIRLDEASAKETA